MSVKILRISECHVKPHGKKLITTETFSFRYECNGMIKYVVIPKGFVYNGASIPVLRSDYMPQYLRAALVHDYFCVGLNAYRTLGLEYNYTVKEISEIFGEILRMDDVPNWKAEVFERSVHLYKRFF